MLLTLAIGNTGNYSRSLVEQRVNVSIEGRGVESGIKGWRADLDIEGRKVEQILV